VFSGGLILGFRAKDTVNKTTGKGLVLIIEGSKGSGVSYRRVLTHTGRSSGNLASVEEYGKSASESMGEGDHSIPIITISAELDSSKKALIAKMKKKHIGERNLVRKYCTRKK